jgi:segregation and condensation protein B
MSEQNQNTEPVEPEREAVADEPAETEREAAADEPAETDPAEQQANETAAAEDKPRTRSVDELPPEARAMCKTAIEAMLFASGEPVTTRRLADALAEFDIDGRGVRKLIGEISDEYDESGRGFSIEELAGGFQMRTRPEYAEYVGALAGRGGSGRLSQAALETLAVVAYKQPVTRADVEAIRGVQAGPLLRSLLHKKLVRITGRAEVLGRPLLYGTTKAFLEYFGLKSLGELPKVEELPRP